MKSYNKTKPINFGEFKPIQDWWGTEKDDFKSRVETKHAWKVSIEEITSRDFNLDINNPFIKEQTSQDPNELISQYKTQQDQIQNLLIQLKNALNDSLKGDE